MSQLPAGITTASVHMDAPLSFIGEPGRLHVTLTPSATLVWAETGTPIGAFTDSLSLDPGVELRIDLPHTDQPGFLDGNGNEFTGWYYTVEITYERDGEQEPFPSRDFQILSGQDEVDLALIPSGEAYVPEVAPILPVTSVNGQSGVVVLDRTWVGLGNVDNTSDAAKPVSTAQAAALALKAPLESPTFTGMVGGITKAMVGLGAVDNTADADKPVSAAVQAALDGKSSIGHTHIIGDVTGLQGALDAKAPLDNPTFTGTVGGITKTMVGLSNVDNTSDAAKPVSTAVSTALAAKAPLASPTFTGTVSGITKSMVGLGNVDNTADSAKPVSSATQTALNLKADKTAIDGIIVGDNGKKYRMVAFTLRHNGTTFEALDDAGHTPVGISSVSMGADSITVNFNFTALTVGAAVAVGDETLARAGYTFGASVGLTSMVIYAAQPGGFGDYLNWNGSAWVSLNGFITSASMNGTTGEVTCNHATLAGPVGGSVVSRSDTKRASMEGLGASTTNFKLMDNAGVSVKTPTTDNRVWITRTGSRNVPPTELVQANSNIWVQGLFEVA